jgi:hypothetical protein
MGWFPGEIEIAVHGLFAHWYKTQCGMDGSGGWYFSLVSQHFWNCGLAVRSLRSGVAFA